jgi:hypothetical protein
VADYGYLHLGRITGYDATSGGYFLDSIGLARTSKWGPTPSCVPGLSKGDRVVLGATGTSRDNLIIISKVGAEFASISDIDGLLDALHSKADAVAIDQLANWNTAQDVRLDALETGAGGLDTRVDALEADSISQDARLDVLEGVKASGGSWYVNEDYYCPGGAFQECDRMPFAGELWKLGTDLTLGPDNKHLIVNRTGIWRPTYSTRYLTPSRVPSGTPGEGTDRTFHIGVTALDIGPSNSTFETGVSGWTASTCTLASSTTQKHAGTKSAQVTPTGAAAQAAITGSQVNVAPGQKWTVLTWVWCTNAVTTNYAAAITWYDAGGAVLSTSSTPVSIAAATWTPVFATFTAPASAAKAAPVAVLTGTPAAGQIFYVDDVSICPSTLDSNMFFSEEGWAEQNTGNQHNQTRKMGLDIPLAAGNKVMLFCYWGGPTTDRLLFPGSSNRMSMTYVGAI